MLVRDLVRGARLAVAGGDPARHGLARLSGGMSHDVFSPLDATALVAKVFEPAGGDESDHEWAALVSLAGSGIAPEPVHFDDGVCAVIVMTRVFGSSLNAGALQLEHARLIGSSHRRVHEAVPSSRQLTHSGVWAARTSLLLEGPDPPASRTGDVSEAVVLAWRKAWAWIASVDVDKLLSSVDPRFSRGDPNLSNYLWDDGRIVLIDWENSGHNDRVLELADMAEHASTRALEDDFWVALADATGLTANDLARLPQARRLMACFWLVLIESRHRHGLPTTVTLEAQADRTLAVLDR